ncbi:MAG: motB [Rhodospirillales bacterium]|nr:motB [Rhodospirillales bacterium]
MLSRRGRREQIDAWPGWVDALSSLVIVVIFVLMVFVVGQVFLQSTLVSRDKSLAELSAKLAELNRVLGIQQGALGEQKQTIASLTAERDAAVTSKASETQTLLDQIAALEEQLKRINDALGQAEASKSEQDLELQDLSKRLNELLAGRMEEMARYRSEFFGRLRAVLGDRPDVRIVGDRFVFQSEVLFPSGSATLQEGGKTQLASLAKTLLEIAAKIPPGLNWILRVDGHTDKRPIRTAEFPNNWALSTARGVAVVQFLIEQGVPPERLAAAGFGEFQPIEAGTDEASLAKNRRIELKLDQR